MNQLQAMKDQNIRISIVDDDDGLVVFANGVVLPIIAYWSEDRSHRIEDLEDGVWIEFGNDEVGYGWYPVRMITEEEYRAENRRALEAAAASQRRT